MLLLRYWHLNVRSNMIKGMIKEGKLVPSATTVKLILKAIADSSNSKFLIDGFPRNDENREVWDRVVRTVLWTQYSSIVHYPSELLSLVLDQLDNLTFYLGQFDT